MTTASSPSSWPDDLVAQAVQRNLVLVVGSGVSASCELSGKHPPSWDGLLNGLVSKLSIVERKAEIEELIEKERLLDAAELVKQEAKRLTREQDFYRFIRGAVDGSGLAKFQGSAWHDAIIRLEPDLIITTNFDNILERATQHGYSTHSYKSERVAGEVRRKEPTLLKIHGSVDEVEDIIFARTDYTRLRLHGVHALTVLQALFLTRTTLLLGYSLRDPDIQLLLENVFGGRNETPAHYMLAQDSLPDYERDVLRYSYGIGAITYPTGQHGAALTMLQELAELVQSSKPAA